MSGHSKWANIRVKKTAEDAKRGKVFTKHAKLIEIAARSGGADPTTNNALRTAMDNAREDNVPNTNIERAIKKGTGELKGEQMAEIMYAAYGPANSAFLIECLTDNRNRTLSHVKTAVSMHGGRWAELGSVQWMFERKGAVVGRKAAGMGDELELKLIDAGAAAIDTDGDVVHVTTDAAHWPAARDLLKAEGFEILEAGLKYMPSQTVAVADAGTAGKILSFIEAIEEDDDVSEVHTNADITADIAAQVG